MVSLLLVVVIAGLDSNQPKVLNVRPLVLQAAVLLAVIIPGWSGWWSVSPLQLPAQAESKAAIAAIQSEIDSIEPGGKVLFIDQRQLITFGAIRGVEFFPNTKRNI